jgi:predicted hydrolase (HD superfamily)
MVRPTGIQGMKPKSVKKKLKQPSFAAAVDRAQVQRGMDELGVDPDEHIALIIEALAERSEELGIGPREGGGDEAS